MHIEVTVAKLKRRFGVEVLLKPPRIPYRETIKERVEAHGRHKKQTGGHGQFGDCKIRLEPLPRGSEFEFVDEIFGGSIPRQFIPAVEKGIQESRLRGFLAGYPVVDFRVVLYDGSYHDVDSNELSFKTAGWLAFKDGMGRARPTLLEPIMNVEIYAPGDNAGDLMGDLNGRRGRISGMEARGLTTVIKAQVPMSEMLTYEQHLTSVTGGRGSYHMEYSHYDEVPSHLQTKIVAASKSERGHVAEEPRLADLGSADLSDLQHLVFGLDVGNRTDRHTEVGDDPVLEAVDPAVQLQRVAAAPGVLHDGGARRCCAPARSRSARTADRPARCRRESPAALSGDRAARPARAAASCRSGRATRAPSPP